MHSAQRGSSCQPVSPMAPGHCPCVAPDRSRPTTLSPTPVSYAARLNWRVGPASPLVCTSLAGERMGLWVQSRPCGSVGGISTSSTSGVQSIYWSGYSASSLSVALRRRCAIFGSPRPRTSGAHLMPATATQCHTHDSTKKSKREV